MATDDMEGTTPDSDLHGEALSKALSPVLLLTFIFFLHFVARQMAGPLLPAMESELGISHAQSGLFIFFMGVGLFISQISSPYLAGTWGYRKCILSSLVGMAAVTAMLGFLDSARALSLGFLALGVAGGLYVPSGIALITVVVRPQDWGKAMGIHELAPNLALIGVPFLAIASVAAGSWRIGYLGVASVTAILAVVYGAVGVDAAAKPSPPSFGRIREITADPSFWHLCVLLSLAVGVETGVYAMLPLFLVSERGFELAAANHLLGLSRIPGLVMVLLAGWISDRLGPRRTISIALGLTGATVAVLGIGPQWFLAPGVFLQAAAAACLFPPILAAASGISSMENRALTISLSLAVAPVIGGGLLPAAIALAGDLGSFGLGLVGAGVLTASGTALVPYLRPNQRNTL
ncbi:MAG: MFS transporter [Desulfobacteraceae bacterium]|nr:MFS transporter [Desulfobacteraceae bacterium]